MGGTLTREQAKPIFDYCDQYVKVRPEVFVETGTYRGDTLVQMAPIFRELKSIEVDKELHRRARDRFAKQRHVDIHRGDSGVVLPQIIANVREPVFFYLDAHYSAGGTGRSTVNDVPLFRELKAINGRPHLDVVVIDDYRLFGTDPSKGKDPGFDWSKISTQSILRALGRSKILRTDVSFDRLVIWMGK